MTECFLMIDYCKFFPNTVRLLISDAFITSLLLFISFPSVPLYCFPQRACFTYSFLGDNSTLSPFTSFFRFELPFPNSYPQSIIFNSEYFCCPSELSHYCIMHSALHIRYSAEPFVDFLLGQCFLVWLFLSSSWPMLLACALSWWSLTSLSDSELLLIQFFEGHPFLNLSIFSLERSLCRILQHLIGNGPFQMANSISTGQNWIKFEVVIGLYHAAFALETAEPHPSHIFAASCSIPAIAHSEPLGGGANIRVYGTRIPEHEIWLRLTFALPHTTRTESYIPIP